MTQRSIAYAVARVRALEPHLLDGPKLARLKESGAAERFRLLQETGYGQRAESLEAAIAAELAAARKLVRELSPDTDITGLFFLEADAHNLKTLLKSRLLGVAPQDLLEDGLFPVDTLIEAVETKDYRALPPAIRQGMDALERKLAAGPNPQLLSAAVDRAVFEHIAAVLADGRHPEVQAWFAAKADYLNAMSLLRARALGWDAERLANMLLPGGDIAAADVLEAYALSADQLAKRMMRGRNGAAIAQALEECMAQASPGPLERRMDSALMALARAGKGRNFSLGPLVGYLLGREAEARALRLLFSGRGPLEDWQPELY